MDINLKNERLILDLYYAIERDIEQLKATIAVIMDCEEYFNFLVIVQDQMQRVIDDLTTANESI